MRTPLSFHRAKRTMLCVLLGVAFGACTYEVAIDHAAENLDLNLIYSPCEADSGSDAPLG